MQTEIQYIGQWKTERPRSKSWAYVLAISYIMQLVFELSMMQFTFGADGKWVVSTLEKPHTWSTFLLLANGLIGVIATIGFLFTFVKDKKAGLWSGEHHVQRVSGSDFLYMVAWVQAFQIILLFLYGLWLPYPLFEQGSIGSIVESISLQIFMIIAGLLWFRGRGRAIGFQMTARPWKMILSILAMFLFIGLALDVIITTPIADWLHLSLDSERETDIRNGLLDAEKNHWLNGLLSILAVGIIVPIGEEILFRGVVQTYLTRRLGVLLGIVASSFWFAIMHVDIALFVPLFSIGLALGFLRHKFQTIWAPILLHCLNNLMSVIVSMYAF